MPTNIAAWLLADKAHPLEIKPNEYTKAGENQIVVKNAAVALNLVDWATQAIGTAAFSTLKHPAILGHDVAGEAVEVGSAVKHINVGDRVIGLGLGPIGAGLHASAFQSFTVVEGSVAARIPDKLAFTDAAVIPLALSTAASGLFGDEFLGLSLPTIPATAPRGETLLIWGGASSVGTNAIQMVKAAGYEIITTASSKNWDYLNSLGAAHTFDYNSKTVVQDIVKAFEGKKSVGALAIGQTSAPPCIDIVSQIEGNKFVACANLPPNEVPEGVIAKFIIGDSLVNNEVGPALFGNFIPKGLESGSFVASPPAEVIGKGLEVIQGGLDRLPAGVSAKKLVVDLS